MVNRYSHAIVLSYYESQGWISLPPSFQSAFASSSSQPLYTQSSLPGHSPHGHEPISTIRYHHHHPAPLNRKGCQQTGPLTDPPTPRSTRSTRSTTPRARAQAPPTAPIAFTTTITTAPTTRSPLKLIRSEGSALRPTPSIITEIFDPEKAHASAAASAASAASAAARKDAQSPLGSGSRASPLAPLSSPSSSSSSPSSHQRISTLTNYDCPSPTSTIFNLLGPVSSSQDDGDYTPPLTNSGSSVSSSFRLDDITPSFSDSPTDSHDSPILKPFDDFVPTFDDFSQYDIDTGSSSSWHDPASPTAPTIFRLPSIDLSIHPALRGQLPPPPPPPPMEGVGKDDDDDDAIPPPITRHRRTGTAKLLKVDRSAMSFLKQQPATAPLSSSKREGGEYYFAGGNSEPPAIPLNGSSIRHAAPQLGGKGRQDHQMGTAIPGPIAFEQPSLRANHLGLSDWLKGNRPKR